MSRQVLEKAFAESGLPGAVALIADRDGVRLVEAFGHADATTGAAMEIDTIFQIASMTKAIVSAGAMQLVESGALDLDAPIGDLLPQLADPQVLTGFSDSGEPQLRPASRPITLRHLLTHTAGLGYFFIRPEVLRYFAATGMPAPGSLASIQMPLLFDPGENWEYSVATDWVGLAVEAASGKRLGQYLQSNLLDPLGMSSTAFLDALPDDAAKVHARTPEGDLAIQPMFLGGGEFDAGGGGLSSTAHDYGRFVRMMLRGGELDGHRVLAEATVAEMARNQVAPLRAGFMGSAMPDLAQPYDTFPDQHTGWGLGFLINPEQGPNGRAPGSLAWAGIFNSYYWIDPANGVGGVMMSQLAPFGDAGALGFFGALERTAYGIEA
ncbi:MAG TPA: serine hydrolase domain-containing protein [Sphingorhabdus sp.]|jgi:CubicO group peptidase (beta-lactamase class C family)|uniref:serine hydrolase domain-containing protein n=1 Tax=Sphingorhabdus sp. TaxID=1902408 RepID=UPI002BB4A8EA|nr:serine hydrolase domain-containing protein [Sphingorhabdus sp.]HMT40966.1 serine hydrolase domain-containing protein [Sphingorhabdus sp.]HMU23248.1 serine hydrolase domain-containing protein [Sphingorhabdus sp.]